MIVTLAVSYWLLRQAKNGVNVRSRRWPSGCGSGKMSALPAF